MTLATPRRKRIGLRTRFAVLQAGGFRCFYCGRGPADGAVLEVDHRVPRAAGGSNERTNLVVSCQSCNNGKGATLLTGCEGDRHTGPYQLMDFPTGDRVLWCLPCTQTMLMLGFDGRFAVLA